MIQLSSCHRVKILLSALCLFICVSGCTQNTKNVCSLEIYDTQTKERKVLCSFTDKIEAPNWSRDGKYLIYNSLGKLYKVEIQNPKNIEEINTGFANRCNNDHILSLSGDKIALSHNTKEDGQSRIYIVPYTGGTPTLITPIGVSYLHGWSPDGKWLSYFARRNGKEIEDVFIIPAEGGEEIQLTNAPGVDDGPEFSPDGQYIWFNSSRTGLMQVWKMKIDGSEQTQVTFDERYNSWFPHISPNGEQVVFISYYKEDIDPQDHPADKNVVLQLMPISGENPQVVVELFGGQGTINVPSWSPDSKKFAFVSYKKK